MRVLVATDGSAAAELGVELAAQIDWPSRSVIHVVQAVETGAALLGGMWPAPGPLPVGELESELRQQAEESLGRHAARLARPGLVVEAHVLRGRAASAIVTAAGAMPADVIVMGNRGHGTIPSMLLGSVSSEVVDHASIPVLIARGRSISRVTLAWDGSSFARHAADVVRGWPIFAASTVQVVTVADITLPWWAGFPAPGAAESSAMSEQAAEATRRDRDALAAAMTAELRDAGLDAVAIGREGDAAAQIIAAARAAEADLIVVGTHGRTGISRLALGSVARNVLHHSPCSVLIAPPERPAASRETTSTKAESRQ